MDHTSNKGEYRPTVHAVRGTLHALRAPTTCFDVLPRNPIKMWFSSRIPLLLLCSLSAVPWAAAGEQMLTSSSLNTCQDNSGFTASLFDVTYTPGNATASVDIVAVSSIQGNVVFDISITAYGYQIISQTVNPCNIGLAGLCPMYAPLEHRAATCCPTMTWLTLQ